jgi:hypothetical protein
LYATVERLKARLAKRWTLKQVIAELEKVTREVPAFRVVKARKSK